MAFPTIQTADTTNGTVTSNDSTWDLTYPTNLASGDLILGFIGCDGTAGGSFTWPTDWAEVEMRGTAVAACAAAKISTGSETGTFTVTLGASEQGGWRVFRITGWYGSNIWSAINIGDGGIASADAITVTRTSSDTGGTSNTPNPPDLNPTNWDVEDTLWFAGCAADTSRTISVYPLGDNNTADVSGGSNGATLGLCTTNSAVASLNPGTFTISASDDWVAFTAAVRPAAGGGGTTYTKTGFGRESA